MSWTRHFRVLADRTEPGPGAVDRVRKRAAASRDLLRVLPEEPERPAVERLRARFADERATRTRAGLSRRGWPRRAPRFDRGRLAVAAGVFVVAGWIGAWLGRHEGHVERDEPLVAAVRTERALSGDVRLAVEGEGVLGGPASAPRIAWTRGSLEVDVTPGRGVDLVVSTPESTVHVIGTRFRVVRDALGTTVDVERGHVSARCAGAGGAPDADHDLFAGASVVCPPTRPAGLLARAIRREERGDPASDVLVDVDAGIRLAPAADPIRSELLALRIELLLRAGHHDEAAAAAAVYLADPDAPRRDEVEALARSFGIVIP